MNREIKFRAWDKYSKRGMIYPNNGDFIGWHAPSNWRDCYDVMQFTGLIDKNGKEIYEGDIIKYINPSTFKEIVSEVRFYGGAFCYESPIGLRPLHNTAIKYSASIYDFEVIGNIYETTNKGGENGMD